MSKSPDMGKFLLLASLLFVSPCYAADLVGPVSDDSVQPVIEELAAAPSNSRVHLTIDSEGGSVGAGLGLIRAMRSAQRRNVLVVCTVDGMAASMAAVVLQVCDARLMTKGSLLLFHSVSSECSGNAVSIKRCAGELQAWDRMLAILAASKMNISLDEYLRRVDGRDYVLSPYEAVDLGAADAVLR